MPPTWGCNPKVEKTRHSCVKHYYACFLTALHFYIHIRRLQQMFLEKAVVNLFLTKPRINSSSFPPGVLYHRASFAAACRKTWFTPAIVTETASSTRSPGTAVSTVGCSGASLWACLRSVSV